MAILGSVSRDLETKLLHLKKAGLNIDMVESLIQWLTLTLQLSDERLTPSG